MYEPQTQMQGLIWRQQPSMVKGQVSLRGGQMVRIADFTSRQPLVQSHRGSADGREAEEGTAYYYATAGLSSADDQ